jgi:transposase
MYSLLGSLRKTAKLLQVCHTTVHRWLKSPDRKTYSTRQKTKGSALIIEIIRSALANDPFLSAKKLQTLVSECGSVELSKSLVHNVIKKSGMTKKKTKMYGAPPDLEAKTAEFCRVRGDLLLQNYQFLSIGETSFGSNFSPSSLLIPKNS